ncbi:hypothetical protein [Tropicibacter sp. Alg240-R139]|uniref:hypothetical protein n=1 Tax=Tropicibacter sp. Alg240-R139 TaxID=2305991 RepID=UPI0013E02850|nr:hypothetical protein [Tropicibacter sp. Alg240-R139]
MKQSNFATMFSTLMVVQGLSIGAVWAADTSQPPAVILCTIEGTTHYAYLSVVGADGTARYQSVGGGVAEFSADGTVKAAGTMNTGNCSGKTIKQLRQDGQTREFSQP